MNGHVLDGTPIAVDYWRTNEYSDNRLHFLSHLHADHIVGLNSNWNRPIYTSKLNAKLLTQFLDIKIERKFIKDFEVGTPNSIAISSKDTICVTLLDANHCPGAVMFLFQGYFGNILYTGDFRYQPSIISDISVPINILYLDNTYCSPEKNHPTRDDAFETILSVIYNHPDKRIIFGMRKLGKEQLLVQIARVLKTIIKVTTEDYRKMEMLNIHQYFTCDNSSLNRIEVIPFDKLFRMKNTGNAIRILPTSLMCEGKKANNLYIVPYSDHSNFKELLQFVKQVRPQTVKPIISGTSLGIFQEFLNPSRKSHHLEELSLASVNISSVAESASSTSTATSNNCKRKRPTRMGSKKLLSVSKLSKNIVYFDSNSSDEDDCVIINES